MGKSPAIGIVLGITALVVLIPVLLQMKNDGRRFTDVWGYFVFAAGLLGVAAGYAFFTGAPRTLLAVGGLAAALLGLFVQHRDRDRDRDSVDRND
jgi:hypothetical protein